MTSASFTLPDDERGGGLIFFGDQREPIWHERLEIDADDRIERIFRRITRFKESGGARRA